MNRYTIRCTEVQTKKAFGLGAPLLVKTRRVGGFLFGHSEQYYVIPNADQMIGWLEDQTEEKIYIQHNTRPVDNWNYQICSKDSYIKSYQGGFKSRKDATLAAIDVALDYLIKNKT